MAVDQEQLIRGVLQLAESLSSGLPLEVRLTDLCRTTVQLLGCDRSSIFLREGRHYRAKYNHGNPPDLAPRFPQFKVSLRDPLISRAMETRSFVLVNDAQDSPLMNAETARRARIQSIVVAPLFDDRGEPSGFITAEYNENFGVFTEAMSTLVLGLAKLAELTCVAHQHAAERQRAEAALRFTRLSLDNAGDAMVCVDRDARYIDVNDAFCRATGYSREELLSMRVHDIDPDYPADIWPEFWERLKQTGSFTFESRHRTKGGKVYPVEIVTRFFEHNGKEYHCAFAREITERKRTEAELRDSRNMLQTVLDTIPSAVVWKDRDSIYLGGNRRFLKDVGLKSSEEVVGKSDFDLPWEEGQADSFRDYDRRVMESGIPEYDIIEPYRRADGTQGWANTNKVPLRDTEGNVVGILGTYEDITERKQAQVDQQLAVEVLHLLNRPGDLTALVEEWVRLIQRSTDFEAVGVRLRAGEDFPYFVATGFPEDFVCAEQYLCARDQAGELVRDSEGNPVLECMCGNILCGRTNPALPFFTQGGSFWTNSTTHLLATTTEADRLARTRNRCNAEGYESVALIPLRSGDQSVALMPLRSGDEIIGLLQLNDRRPGRFTPEFVRFLEGLADSIGIALKRGQATEQIKAQLDELQRWHEVMLGREDRVQELKREVNELCGRMGETARYPSQEADSAASEALGAKGVAIKSLERRSK